MADNLESFFKNNLSNESSEDNWNIPSDDVWEKTLLELQKKSGVFIPWKYLYILGLVTIVGFAIVFLIWDNEVTVDPIMGDVAKAIIENTDENQYPKTIIHYDNLMIEIEDKNNIDEKPILQKETTKEIVPFIVRITNNNQSENIKSEEAIKTNIVSPAEEKNTHKNTIENISQLTSGKTLTNQVLIYNEPEVLIADTISIASINNISDSVNKQVPEINTFRFPDSINNTKIENTSPNYKGKIGIGVFFSPTLNETYLSGDMISGIIKSSNVYLYSGNYGLEIKYFLSNRFAIVSGFGRSEVKSWSKSFIDFNYNSSTEHLMDNGEKENTSPVRMPTPFGEVNTEITYQFPGSDDLPNGELMQSELETHQNILYLSIPLGIEYNIINYSRLNWFAEGGFRFNRSILDGSEYSSRIIHLGNDMNVMGEKITNTLNYKETYFNYYLGTGANYHLSTIFQVNASIRYFGNISNVNLQDDMSTNVRGFNLKIGILYLF